MVRLAVAHGHPNLATPCKVYVYAACQLVSLVGRLACWTCGLTDQNELDDRVLLVVVLWLSDI